MSTNITQTQTGTATITANNTSVTVPHGLSTTPTLADISITSLDDLGGRDFWPSDPDATNFKINLSSMDADAVHQFSWAIVYTIAGTPTGTYCTSDDVKAFSKITYLDLGYASDVDFVTLINSLIAYAGALIDEYCQLPETFFNATGYAVTAEMYDYKFPYTQLYVYPLYRLPPVNLRYQPVLSVTKVEYNTQGYGLSPVWVEVTTPGYILDPIACSITLVTKLPAMQQLSIRVTYTAGYTTTPNAIRYTCAQICANMLHEFLQRKISPQVTPTDVAVKLVTPDSFPVSLQESLKHFVRRFVSVG